MYRKSITELPEASVLSGSELIALVQDGKTKKVSISDSVLSVKQVYVSSTEPDNPFEGQLWFRTDNTRLYSWNVGQNSSQWVQV